MINSLYYCTDSKKNVHRYMCLIPSVMVDLNYFPYSWLSLSKIVGLEYYLKPWLSVKCLRDRVSLVYSSLAYILVLYYYQSVQFLLEVFHRIGISQFFDSVNPDEAVFEEFQLFSVIHWVSNLGSPRCITVRHHSMLMFFQVRNDVLLGLSVLGVRKVE